VRFKNKKHKCLKQTTSATETLLTNLNPLHAFRNVDILSGRALWCEATRASISERATKDREASGDPPSKQIGYFQSAEKRAWDALSFKEKEKWANDALQPQESPGKSYTCPEILRWVVPKSNVFVCVLTTRPKETRRDSFMS
jgi:hypothetical protein